MYEWMNATALSFSDVEQSIAYGEVNEADLFTQISAILTATGVLTLIQNSPRLLNGLLTLGARLLPPSEQPFLSPIDKPEDLAILMAHGNMVELLENEKIVKNILETITSQNIPDHGVLIYPKTKLDILKNLLKDAKPDNIKLLMEKISLDLFEHRRISVGDFLQILDSLTDAQAMGFVEGIFAAGSEGLLLENGAVTSSSDGFNQFFRCLNPIKQELALDVLMKHMPEMINDIGEYLSVFKCLNDAQKKRVLSEVGFYRFAGNSEKSNILNGFPHEWQSILDDPNLKNLAKLSSDFERLGIMNEELMYTIKERLLKASDPICASAKIERFIRHLSLIGRDFFLMDPSIFLKAIQNKTDIMRVFANLSRSEKFSLFFKMNTHLQHVIAKSNDVQDTLNKLTFYLPGELIAFLRVKLVPFMTSKISPYKMQIGSMTTFKDFFKQCLLLEDCSIILNRLIWEKRNSNFPSFFTESEFKAALQTRYTYSFSSDQIQNIIKIIYPDGIVGFYASPFPSIVKELTPLQLFNFFKIIAPILWHLNKLSASDLYLIMIEYYVIQGGSSILNVSQRQAFLASFKTISTLLIKQCADQGLRFGGCGIHSSCDPTLWMTIFRLTPKTQKYYFDTFIAPNVELIFNSRLQVFNDDETPDEGEIFDYRLSIFFSRIMDDVSRGVIWDGQRYLGLLNNFQSTVLHYHDEPSERAGATLDYGDTIYKIQTAFFNILKETIVREVNTVSELSALTFYLSTEQFEIVCEEIRDKFPNRFRLSDLQSLLTGYPSTFKIEYRRIALKTMGEYDCHNEVIVSAGNALLSSLDQEVPEEANAFFNALKQQDVNGLRDAYNRLNNTSAQSRAFLQSGFFKKSLRQLPKEHQAPLEAAGIDPYVLNSPCL